MEHINYLPFGRAQMKEAATIKVCKKKNIQNFNKFLKVKCGIMKQYGIPGSPQTSRICTHSPALYHEPLPGILEKDWGKDKKLEWLAFSSANVLIVNICCCRGTGTKSCLFTRLFFQVKQNPIAAGRKARNPPVFRNLAFLGEKKQKLSATGSSKKP